MTDRYLLSNVVYQGYGGGLDPEEIWAVGRASTGGLLPDLTLILDVPPEVASQRVGAPRDRIEDRPDSFRKRVRDGYSSALAAYPGRTVVLDASGPADDVALRIRTEVEHALGIGPRP